MRCEVGKKNVVNVIVAVEKHKRTPQHGQGTQTLLRHQKHSAHTPPPATTAAAAATFLSPC